MTVNIQFHPRYYSKRISSESLIFSSLTEPKRLLVHVFHLEKNNKWLIKLVAMWQPTKRPFSKAQAHK